jgi:outer membrane protein
MKQAAIVLILLAALFLPSNTLFASDNTAGDFSLSDCYRLALKQSETIGIDAQRIKEAEAHFLQALAIVLPQVSISSSDTYGYGGILGPGQSSSPHNYTRNFIFQEALFSGFKEFAAMRASGFEKKQRQKEKERAEQLLFFNVSDSFYLLLEQKEDLEALESIEQALLERIRELNKRIGIGRSRKSEVVTVIAQLYQTRSDIVAVKNQRDVAKELLEFLTGVAVPDIKETDDIFSKIKPEEYYAAQARMRADIEAAENALGAARANIDVAKSGYLPKVTLTTDYYTDSNSSQPGTKADAIIAVNVPIFEGTQVIGNVKQARAQARESELQLQLTGRQAQTDVRQTYTSLRYSLKSFAILKNALVASERNYYLQKRDYRFNVVNNLDVLAAIQTMLNTRINYIHASNDSKRLYWQLCVAAGETLGGEVK